jgi:hypothetical protein
MLLWRQENNSKRYKSMMMSLKIRRLRKDNNLDITE